MHLFYDFFLRGSLPKSGEVVIGQDLAYRLDRDLGDEITVYSPIDHTIGLSIPKKKIFRISGIFSTKLLDYDDQLIFTTLNDGKVIKASLVDEMWGMGTPEELDKFLKDFKK